MNDQEKLRIFLVEQKYITVAVTLDDGTPWAATVRIKRQSGNVFEWDSFLTAEHSKAIATHPSIAMTMFTADDGNTPIDHLDT